jgi:lysophospholipase L1-like esterase
MQYSRVARRWLTAAIVIGVVALAGCPEADLVTVPKTAFNQSLFKSYVALGNSITAGYQSGGITDSTQREGYAAILAAQTGTRYAYASLNYPGCPPPVVNFQTQARLDGGTSTTCALRATASITSVLNNVAVPGAAVIDPISLTTPNSNALTTFILGGETQVERALQANPSFVSIWIGNNDVLPAALSGFATGDPTPVPTFNATYDTMMTELKAGAPSLRGVLIGVVNVTAIPSLFPVQSLYNPMYKEEFNAAVSGNPAQDVPVDPGCNNSGALVSLEIIAALQAGEVAGVSCNTGDPFTLDVVKQGIITESVTAYNAHIEADAEADGFAFCDPNPVLLALKTSGVVFAQPDFTSATNPFGPIFSLDGIHPTALGQQIIANTVITAINTKYAVAIDTVAHP